MATKKPNPFAADKKADKVKGIKEGSKKDVAMDAKKGFVPFGKKK